MLVMIEGLGRKLDPTFNVLAIAQPFGQEAIARLFSPQFVVGQLKRAAIDYGEFAIELPVRLERLLSQLEQGDLLNKTAEMATTRATHALHVIANRLVHGIANVALLLALVLIFITTRREGGDSVLQIVFLVGVGALVVSSVSFLISVWRSRQL